MRHRLCAALLALMTTGTSAAGHASDAKAVSFDEALSNPQLIGHTIDFTACGGIPVSDAPDVQDAIVLFRCGANPRDIADKGEAIIGRVDKATVIKPAGKARSGNFPVFKGRFRGVLRRGTPEENMQGAFVIELSAVSIQSWVEDR